MLRCSVPPRQSSKLCKLLLVLSSARRQGGLGRVGMALVRIHTDRACNTLLTACAEGYVGNPARCQLFGKCKTFLRLGVYVTALECTCLECVSSNFHRSEADAIHPSSKDSVQGFGINDRLPCEGRNHRNTHAASDVFCKLCIRLITA
eukprot:1186754-Prorocentrum_minimum.AAC.2